MKEEVSFTGANRPSVRKLQAAFGFEPLRQGQQGLLEKLGRFVSEPLANVAAKKAQQMQGGIGSQVADTVKSALGDQAARQRAGTAGVLRGSAKWLRSKQGAEAAALGTGALALGGAAGAGYLLSKGKKENENG